MLQRVKFYGTERWVLVTPYLSVGSTIFGVANIASQRYTLTRKAREIAWSIYRKW